jgi:hypothetical protein
MLRAHLRIRRTPPSWDCILLRSQGTSVLVPTYEATSLTVRVARTLRQVSGDICNARADSRVRTGYMGLVEIFPLHPS